MNKIFSITALFTLLLLFSACNDDNKNPQYIYADMQMINHVSNDDSETDEAVCQNGEYEVTINLDDYTASINAYVFLDDDYSGSIDVTNVPVTYNKTLGGYVIQAGFLNNKGTLQGIYDFYLFLDYRSTENPTSRVSFSVNNYRVNGTGNILTVSNPMTTVTPISTGKAQQVTGATYIATFNPDNNRANLTIQNIDFGNNTIKEITYSYLDIKPVKDGYLITSEGDKKPSSMSGANLGDLDKYILQNISFKFNFSNETADATFTIKDLADVTVNGLF